MAEILLTKGKVAIVDDADFHWLSQWNWSVKDVDYAQRMCRKNEGVGRKMVMMHRQILGVMDPSVEVDHINHNTLDNRRINLRLCSRYENQRNQILHRGTVSGFKGVSRAGSAIERWQAQIQINGKIKYLGVFSTKEAAALAYNEVAIKFFGEFACLNKV